MPAKVRRGFMGDDVGYALQDGHTFRSRIEEVCVPHAGVHTLRTNGLKSVKNAEGLVAKAKKNLGSKSGILEILESPSGLLSYSYSLAPCWSFFEVY